MSSSQLDVYIERFVEKIAQIQAGVVSRHQHSIDQKYREFQHKADTYDAYCDSIASTLSQHGISIAPLPLIDRSAITTYADDILDQTTPLGSFIDRFMSSIRKNFRIAAYQDTMQQYAERISDLDHEIAKIMSYSRDMDVLQSDNFFRQSLQYILAQSSIHDDSLVIMRMLHELYYRQPVTDIRITPNSEVVMPHQAIISWFINRYHTERMDVEILAWGQDDKSTQSFDAYHRVLNFIADKSSIQSVRIDNDADMEHWPVVRNLHYVIQKAPIPSPKVEERRRKRLFGELNSHEYTISYAFIPNEYSQQNGYSSEDALLFDTDNEDFFMAVCDGVSQSCLGDIAARNIAQALYHIWILLIRGVYQPTELDNVLRRSFNAAIVRTNYEIHHFMMNPPENFSSTTIDILQKLNKTGGSQTIFACTFSLQGKVYAIWMGNTAIIIQGDTQGIVLNYDDERFQNDSIRFSSNAVNGLRGECNIQIFEHFLAQNTTWRIVIHSDALEEYPDREETLYTAPLERPNGRPLNADDVKLEQCVRIDDTTIVELFYARPSS
jgi:hypothetical protein